MIKLILLCILLVVVFFIVMFFVSNVFEGIVIVFM